jgi:MoaA/NifB/PqqE/SkfB family radical SAM enzyme
MAVTGEQTTHKLFTDSITSHAELHWDRFNNDKNCFESTPLVPVKILDVQSTGLVQPCQVTNEETLDNYIKKKTNSSFKLRLMYDLVI